MLERQKNNISKNRNYAEIRPTIPAGQRAQGGLEKFAAQGSLNVTCRYYTGSDGDGLVCNHVSGRVGAGFAITPLARFYQFV